MDFEPQKSWKKVLETDLNYVAQECKEHLPHKSVLFVEGEMGVGKSSFVRCLIGDSHIPSPSYGIIHEYGEFVHGDFYRIEKAAEIIDLELGLYAEQSTYFFLEWGLKYAHRIEKELGDDFHYFLLQIDFDASAVDAPRNFVLKKITDL